MDIIIVKTMENTVSFLIPTEKALSFATMKQIAEKDVALGLPYWIRDMSLLPIGSTFRDAWEVDEAIGEPDGFGGESNEFDVELLRKYREINQ